MTGHSRSALGGALLCLAALSLLAPETALAQDANTPPPSTRRKGTGEVSFDVEDRPLKDVVGFIQERTEVTLFVSDEAADVPLTLVIQKLPWREALELVVRKSGCQMEERSAKLIIIDRPTPVTFDFENADLRVVIKTVADLSGANIVVGPEVQGSITLSLRDIPWRVALETIVRTLGYTVVEEQRGILRVVDPANLQEDLHTRIYPLRYIRPAVPYRPQVSLAIAQSAATVTGDTQADIESEFMLLKAFRQAVAPSGSVDYIKANNSLVATGTAPKLKQLEDLLAKADIEPVQIYVDVKFITTTNSDMLEVGINPGEGGFNAQMTLGRLNRHRLPFRLGKGGFEDDLLVTRNDGSRGGPFAGSTTAGDFTFGVLDFSQTQISLNLIRSDTKTRILQAPKLMTLDHQEATIFVGDTVRYAETKAQSNQSGGLEFSISEAPNSPVQTGFQLLVIPHVIPGTDEMLMTIMPQQRQLTGPVDGFREYKTGAGGTTGEQTILLPEETQAEVLTHMKIRDGQTAVIGGLTTHNESETVNKIPWLGDLPLIGILFRGERSSDSRTHIIIFVTPRLVRDDSGMRELVLEELKNRQNRLNAEMIGIYGDEGEDPDATPPVKPGMQGPK